MHRVQGSAEVAYVVDVESSSSSVDDVSQMHSRPVRCRISRKPLRPSPTLGLLGNFIYRVGQTASRIIKIYFNGEQYTRVIPEFLFCVIRERRRDTILLQLGRLMLTVPVLIKLSCSKLAVRKYCTLGIFFKLS